MEREEVNVKEMQSQLLGIKILDRSVPKECCEKCICFRKIAKTEYGNCHFDPPVMYFDELSMARLSAWPEVHMRNWCKKFENIEE
jgi:hypothetical protein